MWQLHKNNLKLPMLDEFFNFLEQRCYSLELYMTSERASINKSSLHSTSYQQKLKCKIYSEAHEMYYCDTILKKPVNARIHAVFFNCLWTGHSVKTCKASNGRYTTLRVLQKRNIKKQCWYVHTRRATNIERRVKIYSII